VQVQRGTPYFSSPVSDPSHLETPQKQKEQAGTSAEHHFPGDTFKAAITPDSQGYNRIFKTKPIALPTLLQAV